MWVPASGAKAYGTGDFVFVSARKGEYAEIRETQIMFALALSDWFSLYRQSGQRLFVSLLIQQCIEILLCII